jgi:CheY-like chemotaxis protein
MTSRWWSSAAPDPPMSAGLRQLRHDLLNPLNVLTGVTSALMKTDLDETQRAWTRMLESTTRHLQEIVERIDTYEDTIALDGRERLADLCTIAAARVGKPFDRSRLVGTIESVVGSRPARILLVDDSDELAAVVRSYLEDTGWALDAVDSGERAVAQATTEHYDAVLMDIDMPGLDGATAAHAIRAADLARGAAPTPIIAMTAFDHDPHPTAQTDVAETAPELVRIDDPDVAPLVPDFLANRRVEVSIFRAALAEHAYTRIRSVAHRLKGNGQAYGFAALSRIGDQLAAAALREDAGTIGRLIDELESYLQRVRIESA